MKKVTLTFYGYTWEEYAFQISSLKGLFVVYKGRLDNEGYVDIKEVLYVGYHNGIIELYDDNIIDSLKQYMDFGERLFLSYAEVPSDTDGETISSLISKAVHSIYKKEKKEKIKNSSEQITITCKGNCELIPQEIIG